MTSIEQYAKWASKKAMCANVEMETRLLHEFAKYVNSNYANMRWSKIEGDIIYEFGKEYIGSQEDWQLWRFMENAIKTMRQYAQYRLRFQARA